MNTNVRGGAGDHLNAQATLFDTGRGSGRAPGSGAVVDMRRVLGEMTGRARPPTMMGARQASDDAGRAPARLRNCAARRSRERARSPFISKDSSEPSISSACSTSGPIAGSTYQFLRERVGYRGLVVSFEPISHNLVHLREKAKADPQWIIRGHALGNDDTQMEINVMKVDLLSSFLSPHPAMVEMFRDLNVVDHKETVEVRRLDSVMSELGGWTDPRQSLPEGGYAGLRPRGHSRRLVDASSGARSPDGDFDAALCT